MKWLWRSYGALSRDELYDAMRLRQEVFVVEQDCAYLDADGRDAHAHHLIGYDADGAVAYARILQPGILYAEVSIGRVVTAARVRGTGAGKSLMHEAIVRLHGLYGNVAVRISAQAYLQTFYEEFGFECTGKEYLEDGIPHKEMLRAKR